MNRSLQSQSAREHAPGRSGRSAAFTLIELLVVMAIIAVLATIGLPVLKGFGKGTGMAGAQRQLLQDLAQARLSAINGRTTVFVVFVPTNVLDILKGAGPGGSRKILAQLTNLVSGQYTAYALLTKRTVGDQPGQEHPRYISEWKRLPQGILIATNKFSQAALDVEPSLLAYPPEYKRAFAMYLLPFPTGKSPRFTLPYIAFNSQGQLVYFNAQGQLVPSGSDQLIPLAEGSIFFKDINGKFTTADVVMKPPNNYTNHFIRINWLTGRAGVDERTRPRFAGG